jgi:hypothetical protein
MININIKSMYRTLLIFLIVFQCFSIVFVAQKSQYFPNLKRVSVDADLGVFFNYDTKTTRLINKPCFELDKTDQRHCTKDSVYLEWIVVAKYKSKELMDSVYVIYTAGWSSDPCFGIYSKNDDCLLRLTCLDFYINNQGTIYTAGHTNNMYNRKRKYQLQADTAIEVKQPYNYVGLKGKTSREVTLYSDTLKTEIVAKLPVNYEIEILLTSSATRDFDADRKFLVKTEFGLVGWFIEVEGGEVHPPLIGGLFYNGD